MDPNPFVRTSFWNMALGLSVSWIAISGVGQSTVQRFLSVPDLRAGQKCFIFIFIQSLTKNAEFGLIFVIFIFKIGCIFHTGHDFHEIVGHFPGTYHLCNV